MNPARFELLQAEPMDRERFRDAYVRLVCREEGPDGQFLEHDHRDGGHCFVMTRVDAIHLLNQLIKVLYQL